MDIEPLLELWIMTLANRVWTGGGGGGGGGAQSIFDGCASRHPEMGVSDYKHKI